MNRLIEKLNSRFPTKDWSHCEENTPFSNNGYGVYSIDPVLWYADLPQWTSGEIKTFLES